MHRNALPRSVVVAACGVFVASLLAWGGASCGERACEDASHCQRSCDCINTDTNQRETCGLAFRCEGDTQTCEAAFAEMTCDELCGEYQRRGLCGVERCASDAECLKAITCPILDANNQPTGLSRDCRIPFVCDINLAACEPASTLSDAALCQSICANAPVQ